MKYPTIKVDGKPIKLNKKLFDFIRIQIKKSIAFDNQENDLGLIAEDIKLLSWNGATMLFPIFNLYHHSLIQEKANPKENAVRIEFHNLTEQQMKHLHNAEQQLLDAGVSFDTGYDFEEKRRDWEFDWSLKGAKVKIK